MTRRPSAVLPPLTADAYHTTADAMRPGDGAENQMMYEVGPDGHAKALRLVPKGHGDFLAHLDATRDRYPLDPADIVMPDGWTLNADGSATRDVVVDGVTVARLTSKDIELPEPLTSPNR